MITRRHAMQGLAAFGGLAAPLSLARSAHALPVERTASMIVGFAAGGGTDASARLYAERLRGVYAPNVIIENKVGAAARVGVEYVKNAAPDGSVMLFTPDFPITLYPHIFKRLNYDPLKDLVPVAPLTASALVVSVGPAVPASVTNIKMLLDWARANPTKANFATTGAGGTPHFTGVMISKEGKVPLTAVHYRGGAPALQDLIAGHIPISINPIGEAKPQADGGKLRLLAVASSKRSRFLPNVPTLREEGLDIAFDTWSGVFVPAKTPAPIVAALSAALEKASKAPEMIAAQAKFGNELVFETPDRFAQSVKAATEKWKAVVAASGFVPTD